MRRSFEAVISAVLIDIITDYFMTGDISGDSVHIVLVTEIRIIFGKLADIDVIFFFGGKSDRISQDVSDIIFIGMEFYKFGEITFAENFLPVFMIVGFKEFGGSSEVGEFDIEVLFPDLFYVHIRFVHKHGIIKETFGILVKEEVFDPGTGSIYK